MVSHNPSFGHTAVFLVDSVDSDWFALLCQVYDDLQDSYIGRRQDDSVLIGFEWQYTGMSAVFDRAGFHRIGTFASRGWNICLFIAVLSSMMATLSGDPGRYSVGQSGNGGVLLPLLGAQYCRDGCFLRILMSLKHSQHNLRQRQLRYLPHSWQFIMYRVLSFFLNLFFFMGCPPEQ